MTWCTRATRCPSNLGRGHLDANWWSINGCYKPTITDQVGNQALVGGLSSHPPLFTHRRAIGGNRVPRAIQAKLSRFVVGVFGTCWRPWSALVFSSIFRSMWYRELPAAGRHGPMLRPVSRSDVTARCHGMAPRDGDTGVALDQAGGCYGIPQLGPLHLQASSHHRCNCTGGDPVLRSSSSKVRPCSAERVNTSTRRTSTANNTLCMHLHCAGAPQARTTAVLLVSTQFAVIGSVFPRGTCL
jgi:hypothetical protein